MSSEQNKAIARRIPLEVFSQGRLDVVDELLAPDFTEHTALPPGIPAGRAGVKAIASELRKGFPDINYRVDLQIAEGDFVAAYVTVSGTHKGEVFGMPATGKHAEWAESHIVKLVNGKITEHWGVADQLGMLRQLGLAPVPEAVPAGR
jgi:predicted ester cyclase